MLLKTSNKKINPLLIVSGLFILLLSLFTYLFFECQNWVGENAGQAITTSNYFITGAVLLAFDICFLLFSLKYFKINIRIPFLIAALTGIAFGIITLAGFPGATYNGEIVYVPEKIEILKGICTTILVFFAMYLYTVVIPQVVKGRKYYKIYYIIGALVGLYGVIHSYVFEAEIYQTLFTNPHAYVGTPQSFTTNRNVYAFILVMAMLCEAYLIVDDRRIWHWPLMFFLFVNVLFTFSKTAIIIAIIALLMFVAWMVIRLWKKYPVRATILIASTLAFGVSFLIVSKVEFTGFLGKWQTFLGYLFKELPTFNENAFESRIYWFNVAVEQLDRHPFTKFFGFGYVNWIPSFYASYSGDYTLYQPMDVAYAIDMLQMGYPGLIIAVGLWVYVVYNIQMLFIRKSKYSFISLLFFVPIILRTVTEGGDLAYPNLSGVVFYLVLLCPMVSERKSYQVEKKLLDNPIVYPKREGASFKAISAVVVTITTVVASAFLAAALANKPERNMTLLIWSFIALASGISLSILLYTFIAQRKENKKSSSYMFALVGYVLLMLALFFAGDRAALPAAILAAFAFVGSFVLVISKSKEREGEEILLGIVSLLVSSLMIWTVGALLLLGFETELDGMAILVIVFGTAIVSSFVNLIFKKEVLVTLFFRKNKLN